MPGYLIDGETAATGRDIVGVVPFAFVLASAGSLCGSWWWYSPGHWTGGGSRA
jgi:hypothetical protein